MDYVQGSRFISGGKAVNTPWLRWIAIRLIHAPLISLASKRWMSDTTNGFRGYSKQILLDERIQPFRSIFDRYNLLFYLTIKANQVGFKVCEIPVMRRYPGGSVATPTRISGIKAYLSLLSELFKSAVGVYDPKTNC
jgi:hypothetical protein